jgi:hypothetical protein
MKRATQAYFKQVSNPITLERFKEQVFADLQQFQIPEGIRFDKTVLFVFGTGPL